MSWTRIQQLVGRPVSDAPGVIPGIETLKETRQDPRHHAEGDVFTHTGLCLEVLAGDPGYLALPDEWREALWLATLLHDIGKGVCTALDGDRIVAPHHSRRGATMARRLLWEAGCPPGQRERICNLIALHQVLFHVLDAGGPDIDWVLRRASLKTPLAALIALGRADTAGRLPLDRQTLDALEMLEERARELGCFSAPATGASGPSRLLYLEARGGRPFDLPAYDRDGSVVTFTSGLPGAGKDHWLRTRRPSLPTVSFDDTREELGLKFGKNDGLVTQTVLEKARVLLRQKADFVWNATFLSREMREKALRLVADYRGRPQAVCIEADHGDILARNRTRDRQVPFSAIDKMLGRWEPPGLDEFCAVSFASDGAETEAQDLFMIGT